WPLPGGGGGSRGSRRSAAPVVAFMVGLLTSRGGLFYEQWQGESVRGTFAATGVKFGERIDAIAFHRFQSQLERETPDGTPEQVAVGFGAYEAHEHLRPELFP
ncbi:MAG: hypothetical protein RIE74_18445, partial [Pseudomonadales bacterium]